jgi:hypothetical protein
MDIANRLSILFALAIAGAFSLYPADGQAEPRVSAEQLEKWLSRFPGADGNSDGKLTLEEALAYRDKMRGRGSPGQEKGKGTAKGKGRGGGAPRQFNVDPGWEEESFPEHAISHKSPEEIRSIYAAQVGEEQAVVGFPKPDDGSLRIIGTGHSFMAPGYRTLNDIAAGTNSQQQLYTHTGGGITGSTRYKWEQENGIFQFDRKPKPKLLASLSNAAWDVMTWGPYFNDRPEYYTCWMDFALKYPPEMKFCLSDAWPQLYQLEKKPESESEMTHEVFQKMNQDREVVYNGLIETLREQYGERIFIMPTNRAFTLIAQRHLANPLPGVEGLHRAVGGKERSIWRDTLGHIGEGFERLEGYVFFATLYGKNPADLPADLPFKDYGGFPNAELDRIFREVAWEAVTAHPFSGVEPMAAE